MQGEEVNLHSWVNEPIWVSLPTNMGTGSGYIRMAKQAI